MNSRRDWRALVALLLVWNGAQAAQESGTFAVAIERQPLDRALQQLARQMGVQMIFFSRVTEGVNAPAISGNYTLPAAMERLLDGSGLTFTVINPHTVEVRPRQARTGERTLEHALPVQISAAPVSNEGGPMEEVVVVGLAEQLVATRIATPLREIPQSISIVTGEQMRLRNATDLGDVLTQATGISVQRNSALDESFYSRAYEVTSFHIDGGAAINPKMQSSQLHLGTPDLVEFDHVEILRGADGLFSGNANPGATISLVRKRPQRTYSLTFSAAAGSWGERRLEVDVSGPLARDGDLRGRAAAVYSSDGYYYDIDPHERQKIFAALEYDFSPSATLTAGASYQWDDASGVGTGLPFYADGSDARFPRETALEFDWTRYRNELAGAYLQYRQQLGTDWSLKFNASGWRTEAEFSYGDFYALLDPITSVPMSPFFGFTTARPNIHEQRTADLTLAGTLNWFGLRQEVAIGADFTRVELDSLNYWYNFAPAGDVRDFDPADYPDPRANGVEPEEVGTRMILEQYGGFVSFRVNFDDAWSVVAGARMSGDRDRARQTWHLESLPFLDSVIESDEGTHQVVTPYAGLMYAFARSHALYASYSEIYRSGRGSTLGPVRGINTEAGVKGEWRGGALNGSLAVYRVEQNRLPIWEPPSPDSPPDEPDCCYVGVNNESQGVELEISGKAASNWDVGAGYTFNEIDSPTEGSYAMPTFTPKHLLKAWTNVRLTGSLNRWQVGGSVHAQSETRRAPSPTFCHYPYYICTPAEFTQAAYSVVNLRAGFEIDRHLTLALTVNNVLDKHHYDSIGLAHIWYGEPRNWMLRLDGRY